MSIIATDTISIYRGDTYPFAVRVLNYDGTVFDLTNYTMKITVKSESATEIDEDFPCTTNPTLGIAYGQLSSVMTNMDIADDYTYDIAISGIPVGESIKKVYTVAIGTLAILQDVSDGSTFTEYTLRPNADSKVYLLKYPNSGDNYEKIDESVASDTDYVYAEPAAIPKYVNDIYDIPPVVNAGTIASVTVYFRAKGKFAKALIYPSSPYYGDEESLSASFTEYSHTWATNPHTGLAWTWADMVGLRIGISLKPDSAIGSESYCSQLYAVVTPA